MDCDGWKVDLETLLDLVKYEHPAAPIAGAGCWDWKRVVIVGAGLRLYG